MISDTSMKKSGSEKAINTALTDSTFVPTNPAESYETGALGQELIEVFNLQVPVKKSDVTQTLKNNNNASITRSASNTDIKPITQKSST